MELTAYRASTAEQQRTADLLQRIPASGRLALDIGARDGHFSLLLAERYQTVVALDLSQPQIDHPRVRCVKGNAAALEFADAAFDLVFCAEVLEHVPTSLLPQVCKELQRVASGHIVIGVPYKQDIRVGQTTCRACGQNNPPWGHVNAFDEQRLAQLFGDCTVESMGWVGQTRECTNALSAALLDYAGNPYGTYEQEEPCVHCGATLTPPASRSLAQKIATKAGVWGQTLSQQLASPRGNWIHLLLRKKQVSVVPVQIDLKPQVQRRVDSVQQADLQAS